MSVVPVGGPSLGRLLAELAFLDVDAAAAELDRGLTENQLAALAEKASALAAAARAAQPMPQLPGQQEMF